MSTRIKPVVTRDNDGREQCLYRLGNDYGASVLRCNGAPGSRRVWYDLAVIRWSGETFTVDFTTPITGSVLDSLSAGEVQKTLAEIAALPKRPSPRPTDHTAGLPASVVARGADTDSAHGLTTDDRRNYDPDEVIEP